MSSNDEESAKLTRRAALAVGDNPEDNIELPPLEDQINALPQDAGPLRRILESDGVRQAYDRQKAYGAAAKNAQRNYKTSVAVIILLLIACGLAASYPLLQPTLKEREELARGFATALVYVCLLATLLLVWRLTSRRTYEQWNEARAAAEHLRRKIFDTVLGEPAVSNAGELGVLPLKLEYFRRYQIDLQRTFYGVRALQNERRAAVVRWLIWPCRLIIAGWLVLIGIEILTAWGEQGPLPSVLPLWFFRALAKLQAFSMSYADITWLLVGLGATAAYGATFLFTLLNNNLRNAARYEHARDNFDYLRSNDLEAARKSAAGGDAAGVSAYVSKVHSAMSAEQCDWVRLMDLDLGKGPGKS